MKKISKTTVSIIVLIIVLLVLDQLIKLVIINRDNLIISLFNHGVYTENRKEEAQ